MAERPAIGLVGAYRKRFYKVGEVAKLTGVEAHVLRYWENEFPRLRPGKSRGGQRLYSQDDIELILSIKDLLHEQGFTIAGARRRLRVQRAAERSEGEARSLVDLLEHARCEVVAILTMMEANDKQ